MNVIKKNWLIYRKSLMIELFFFVFLSFWFFLLKNDYFFSMITGFIVAYLPFAIFSIFFLTTKNPQSLSLNKLYLGELFKFGLTILLFIYIFSNFSLKFWCFFSVYGLTIFLNVFLPFLIGIFVNKC